MRLISDLTLATKPTIAMDAGVPDSKKATPETSRVPLSELELAYMNNPIVFNSVNKMVQAIMSSDHYIYTKDQKVADYFINFTEQLGTKGSNLTWEELLEEIFRNQIIFGRSFVENIYSKRVKDMIVDWDIISTTSMDYAKDKNENIIQDKYGNPIGYVQTLPVNYTGEVNDQIPENVRLPSGNKHVYLESKQVAHMKLCNIGNGFYPLGLVEPIYYVALRHLNVDKAYANSLWRRGFPTLWAKIGDLNHEPNPQQIHTMLEKLKSMNNKTEIATPYFYELNEMKGADMTDSAESINYFINEIVAGMGIPEPFATGKGSNTSYSTLAKMDALFHFTLKSLVNKTVNSIRRQMFKPICDKMGFKEVPTIRWDVLSEDMLDKKSRRLERYARSGILTTEDIAKVSEFLMRIENLGEYDKPTGERGPR